MFLGFRPEDPGTLFLQPREAPDRSPGRNLLMTSSCGLCGVRNIETYLSGEIRAPRTLTVTADELIGVLERMTGMQEIFRSTGGTHAAAVFAVSDESRAAEKSAEVEMWALWMLPSGLPLAPQFKLSPAADTEEYAAGEGVVGGVAVGPRAV